MNKLLARIILAACACVFVAGLLSKGVLFFLGFCAVAAAIFWAVFTLLGDKR